ncbi:MAG TPA: hypothetical protein ENN28_04175 [Candidatus Uhrbacteria bacterium]|nr:hypothetical protein [Candidatus Uhrbacteria bacterium]
MPDRCTHLRELLKVQKNIIERHIDDHKWFLHIPDRQEAIADFIEKFGWIMRELYCGYICSVRLECEIAKQYLPPRADPN